MIKVTIRNQRIPEIGDKVASRSAQVSYFLFFLYYI
jgi:DNA-directed RNA polymerase beta subunit